MDHQTCSQADLFELDGAQISSNLEEPFPQPLLTYIHTCNFSLGLSSEHVRQYTNAHLLLVNHLKVIKEFILCGTPKLGFSRVVGLLLEKDCNQMAKSNFRS